MSKGTIEQYASDFGNVLVAELLYIQAGVRDTARVTVDALTLPALFAVAEDFGVSIVVGFLAIEAHAVSGRGGFAEWCSRRSASPYGSSLRRAYLGRSMRLAENLRRTDEGQDDLCTGVSLGYPSCCVSAFAAANDSTLAGDPVLHSYRDCEGGDWRLNASMLEFDATLNSHVPCEPGCDASLKQARERVSLLWVQAPQILQHFTETMRCWVLHSETLGVVGFTGKGTASNVVIDAVKAVNDESVLASLAVPGARISVDGGLIHVGTAVLDVKMRLMEFR